MLSRAAASGHALIVQLPDQRLVAIRSLDPDDEEDSLVSDLLKTKPSLRALVETSLASPRKDSSALSTDEQSVSPKDRR